MIERHALLLLAIMLIGSGHCEMTAIPASQDLYVSIGPDGGEVYNRTEVLLCEINVTEINGSKVSSYPGDPLIQFDISGVNISDNEIGILVLNARTISQSSEPALVALFSIDSQWDEKSDYRRLLLNIPTSDILNKNDLAGISSNTDGDEIFAFDVSKKLRAAKAKGDRISFLLQAVSNSSYEVDFSSRESGQGPYLIVMPYPKSKGDLTQGLNQTATNIADVSSIQKNQSANISVGQAIFGENINQSIVIQDATKSTPLSTIQPPPIKI
ncbi:MAG: hypothetical protein QUS07_08550 [Methanothrix sp.]|nr:hypothetical protein [Methanothrix sp.]